MGATWPRYLGAVCAAWGFASPVWGDDLPPPPPPPVAAHPAATSPTPARTEKANPAEPVADGADVLKLDPAVARAEIDEALKALPLGNDKSATRATKALREVLEERITWLDSLARALKEREEAENPHPSPEKLASDAKVELERIKAILDQSATDPDVLVPVAFKRLPLAAPKGAKEPAWDQGELKEAIDAAQGDLKDKNAKLNQFHAELDKKPGAVSTALRARRDEVFQRVAALRARNKERPASSGEAKATEARALAREKRVNALWEERVEAERLKAKEALLALEGRRAELPTLSGQVFEARVRLAQKTLDRMKAHVRALAARQENDLRKQAVHEKSKAATTDDPLERYRARKAAELLELEARVVKAENASTTDARLTEVGQKALADSAFTEFTEIKKLLDDGNVSHLDALRLTNDFRRIGALRGKVVRNELAQSANQLATAENALSAVEMELIYDARDDQYELENLLDQVPRDARSRAKAIFDDFEKKQSALLERRRAALRKLAAKAEETHSQVVRRLAILDDHYGFIRTHLFWVRDEEPIGGATFSAARRELTQLGRAVATTAAEVVDRSRWGRVSPEFLAAALGLVVLPWPLRRARGVLRAAGRRPAPIPRADDDQAPPAASPLI